MQLILPNQVIYFYGFLITKAVFLDNVMFKGLNKGASKSCIKSPYLGFKIKMLLKDWLWLTEVCFLFQLAITSCYEKILKLTFINSYYKHAANY